MLGPALLTQRRHSGVPCTLQADVSGAYDALPQDKVAEVVAKVLRPHENMYCIRRYAVVQRAARGQARRSYRRHVRQARPWGAFIM